MTTEVTEQSCWTALAKINHRESRLRASDARGWRLMGSEAASICADCRFDWSASITEAIDLVQQAPTRFAEILADGVGPPSEDPKRWSATGYLWHVVDVMRLGTERLWVLTLDPGAGLPGWDEEALAAARRYEALSATVGLRALDVAVRDWVTAARATPADAETAHPVFGTLSARDSIVRNAHEAQHHARDIERTLSERPSGDG